MSKEDKDNVGYVPFRISMKQQKCRDAIGEIQKMQAEMRRVAKAIIGVPRLTTMRGLKEIVSGLAMPMRERK